ncbi:MAG: hypothetical protein ACK4JE_01695 [Endomicrobiia bacterium]
MEDFKDFEEELKKIEEEFSSEEENFFKDVLTTTPSISEYWRKRVEEEKDIWSKIVEKKEQEKKELEGRLVQAMSEIEKLQIQIKELKEILENETKTFQERLKAKETEVLIEKERVNLAEKIRDLERENELLKGEIERLKNNTQIVKEELESVHKRELQEILSEQNSLIENITQLENEIKQLESITKTQSEEINSYRQKLNILTEERDKLKEKLLGLQNKLEYKTLELSELQNEIIEYFNLSIGYFTDKIRQFLGTVIGIVSFCNKKIKSGFLGKNIGVKKQLFIVEETVSNIMSTIEKLMGFSKKLELNLQIVPLENFLIKVSDKIDVASLPSGLKVEVDLDRLLKSLIGYFESTLSLGVTYRKLQEQPIIELKFVIPNNILYDENFMRLKFVIILHKWKIKVIPSEDKSEILVYIPVIEM